MDRRTFLQILGLFSSATVLSSCGSENEQKKLISYLVPPEDGVLPGQAVWKPSTCTECPAHCGLSVRLREGRPVKLEGLPSHPDSRGGLCLRGQASLWRLYHPERIDQPLARSADGSFQPISWEQAYQRILAALAEADRDRRSNLFLSGRITGSLNPLIDRFCRKMSLEHLSIEFYGHTALRQAYQALFGRDELPRYRIDRADFLLSIGADLLETFIHPVAQARQLAEAADKPDFSWYHLEPHLSLTGANAHRRLVIRPGSEADLLAYLLGRLHADQRLKRPLPEAIWQALPKPSLPQAAERTRLGEAQLERLVELWSEASHPLLIVGGLATGQAGGLTPALLAALLQWAGGMTDDTVDLAQAQNYAGLGSLTSLAPWAERLAGDRVGVIMTCATNPLDQLAGYPIAEHFSLAALHVALAALPDATTAQADLLLPLSHSLESWGDTEPRQGLHSLIQPLIKPLHASKAAGDILLELMRHSGSAAEPASYQEYLFAAWSQRFSKEQLEELARQGFVEQPVSATGASADVAAAIENLAGALRADPLPFPTLVVVPSIRTFDGRSRTIPLLAEIPDPLTTISYGRWISLGKESMVTMKLAERDQVRLHLGGRAIELAVKEQPGLAEGIWVVQRDQLLGMPLPLDEKSGEAVLVLPQARLENTGRRARLPILSGSLSQHGRGIIADPRHLEGHRKHPQDSMYPEHEHPDYRWTMVIDLDRCTGCSACVAACYIENSVPVVGPEDHLKGREMSWLRIEPFYDAQGKVAFIPMLCQHCHSAPCEPVCPVYAAYHNGEGLNVQVYDRCVGTRYCANNCPYKVRRFNWWNYRWQPPLDQMVNPDLRLRSRGVMEKCTFCIQRLRHVKDRARDEGRKLREGEVTTACAQSCPTQAIDFGNLLDKESRVYRLAHSPRAYRVFEQLGTQPSVYYLARVRS